MEWMPHGGGLYTAWEGLRDLWELGTVPVSKAHSVLVAAATAWLDQHQGASDDFLQDWMDSVDARAVAVVRQAEGG